MSGTNAFDVWITNVTATAIGGGATVVSFTIQGGMPDSPYDVFANSVLSFGTNGIAWAWEGQGRPCNTYQLTITDSSVAFLVLGTPLDSDGDGLSDAYESLVSKTDPHNPDTDGDGISDADEILGGSNPLSPDGAIPSILSLPFCPE